MPPSDDLIESVMQELNIEPSNESIDPRTGRAWNEGKPEIMPPMPEGNKATEQAKQKEGEQKTETKPEEASDALRKEKGQEGRKEKIETKPEEKPTEPEPEEKPLTARERFTQKADRERAIREKEKDIKLREMENERIRAELSEIKANPRAFIEKIDPNFFEKMVLENLGEKDRAEVESNPVIKTLLEKVSSLESKLDEQNSVIYQQQSRVDYDNYMLQVDRIMNDPKFDAVREYSDLIETTQGYVPNIHNEAARVWTEFKQQHDPRGELNIGLSPSEVCEILLQDAEDRLNKFNSKYSKIESRDGGNGKPKGAKVQIAKDEKRPTPQAQQGLTNEMETASLSATGDEDPFAGKSREEVIEMVAAQTAAKLKAAKEKELEG